MALKDVNLTVRVPRELKGAADRAAVDLGVSLSEVVRKRLKLLVLEAAREAEGREVERAQVARYLAETSGAKAGKRGRR